MKFVLRFKFPTASVGSSPIPTAAEDNSAPFATVRKCSKKYRTLYSQQAGVTKEVTICEQIIFRR